MTDASSSQEVVKDAEPSKAERTRHRIFTSAMALFEREGFEKTTLRKIASEAECSLGLTYRYFANKDDLVVALYERVAKDHDQQFRAELESANAPTTLGERFAASMRLKFALCTPYRSTFASVSGSALNPESTVAALGPAAAAVRQQTLATLGAVVDGAQDVEEGPVKEVLPLLLFVGQLLALLFWVHDDSEHQERTHRLLSMVSGAFDMALPFADHPMAAMLVGELAQTLGPVFVDGVRARTGPTSTPSSE